MTNYSDKKSFGGQAKKSLGQNFLKSKAIVGRIASTANIVPGEFILEIGPGKGILTNALLGKGGRVVAIEKDDSLIEYLRIKFAKEISEQKLFLLHADILDLSASDIFSSFKLSVTSYKLVANIPYYITGEILRKFLEEINKPTQMVVLVQREVAKRIIASDGKESILSVSVKVFGTPKYIETVKRSMFHPAPNVDSAILLIENISNKIFEENSVETKKFFEIVKAGFAHKRKKLSGNLKSVVRKDKFNQFKDCRAEELSILDWISLSKQD